MNAVEPPKLKQFSFNADEGRSEITAEWEFPGIATFAKEAWAFFEKFGGENFVTFDVMPAVGHPVSITIQRPNGKTPAQRIGELEAEIKKAKRSCGMSEQVIKPGKLMLICDADGCGFAGGTDISDDIEWCREAKCPKCGTPFLTAEDFNALRDLTKQTFTVSGVTCDRLRIRTDGNGGLTAFITAKESL